MGLLDRLFGRETHEQADMKMELTAMAGTSMARDPVCGKEVNKEKAPAVFLYLGQTLYFCSPSCQRLFRGNPDEYIKAERHEMAGHGSGHHQM